MRLETEFDVVLARRDRHTAEHIVYAQIVGLFAVEISIPTLAIVDLTEDNKLVGFCGKVVVDLVQIIPHELNGRGAVGRRLEWDTAGILLPDDDRIPDIDTVQRRHFFIAVLHVVNTPDEPAGTECRGVHARGGLTGTGIRLDDIL